MPLSIDNTANFAELHDKIRQAFSELFKISDTLYVNTNTGSKFAYNQILKFIHDSQAPVLMTPVNVYTDTSLFVTALPFSTHFNVEQSTKKENVDKFLATSVLNELNDPDPDQRPITNALIKSSQDQTAVYIISEIMNKPQEFQILFKEGQPK